MKNFLSIIFILIFTSSILCTKNPMVFIADKMHIIELDPDYVLANGQISTINETNFVVNLNFSFLQDLRPVSVHITLYSMQNGVFQQIPLAINKTLCDFWKVEFKKIEKNLRKHSNFPESCHLEEGDYYIKNYVPDTLVFPFDKSPWTRVKFRFKFYFTHTDETLALIDIMAHLDETGKKPIRKN